MQVCLFQFLVLSVQRWFKINSSVSNVIGWLNINRLPMFLNFVFQMKSCHWISDVLKFYQSSTDINILFLGTMAGYISSQPPVNISKWQRPFFNIGIWMNNGNRQAVRFLKNLTNVIKVTVSCEITKRFKMTY